MVKFVRADGLQSLMDTLQSVITKAVETVPECDTHGKESSLTIKLMAPIPGFSWELIDFCCNEYAERVMAVVPPPWKYAQKDSL